MRERITQGHLEHLVRLINRALKTPEEPYAKDKAGKWSPQANCYHLDYAYGGVELVQMDSRDGRTGTREVLSTGHITKRNLYDRMRACLDGIEARDAK